MEQSNGRLCPPTGDHNVPRPPPPPQLQHADLVAHLSRHWQYAFYNGVLFIRMDLLANPPVSTERRRT